MFRTSALVVAGVACVARGDDATADSDATSNPLAKVIDMLAGLQAEVIQEGEGAHKEYESFAEWCEDTSKELSHEITDGKLNVADLKASITKDAATVEELTEKIEELSSTASKAEAELAEATQVRDKEAADAVAEEKELQQTMGALKRALKVLSSGGASMLQFGRARDVVHVLSSLVEGAAINSADGDRLAALVQSSTESRANDEDDEAGAPAAAAYESKSGSIVEILEGLQDKAEDQLESSRKAEIKAAQSFQLLKQSLTDEASVAAAEIEEAKNNIAKSQESKGKAEGELNVASKDLAADGNSLADAHKNCQAAAEEYETGTKSRDQELDALAKAKKVIQEVVSGGSLAQVSLIQLGSGLRVKGQPRAVVRHMLEVARRQNSKSLAQLAHRISSTIKISAARGQDPFGKVKGLIEEMIAKLEKDAGADATHKAYCDKETSESTAKQTDKTNEIDKLTTAVDEMTSRIAVLGEEVTVLSNDLAKIAKSQKEYDEWVAETEAAFNKNKAEAEAGIKGVQLALKTLRDYYANNDSSREGAAGGIVGLLETVEADFSKGLSEMQATFSTQKAAYVQTSKENELTTTAKSQDLKYKKTEITETQKALKETTADRKGVQAELDAINQYMIGIRQSCAETAEPYEQAKARRDAEIAGLKEGLEILEGEAAALLQRGRSSSTLRTSRFLRAGA